MHYICGPDWVQRVISIDQRGKMGIPTNFFLTLIQEFCIVKE